MKFLETLRLNVFRRLGVLMTSSCPSSIITFRSVALMKAASALARKVTAAATSAISPRRPQMWKRPHTGSHLVRWPWAACIGKKQHIFCASKNIGRCCEQKQHVVFIEGQLLSITKTHVRRQGSPAIIAHSPQAVFW